MSEAASCEPGKNLDGLDLHDHFVFDDQIGPEPGVDADVLLDYRDRLLARGTESSPAEFIRQDSIVDRFQ